MKTKLLIGLMIFLVLLVGCEDNQNMAIEYINDCEVSPSVFFYPATLGEETIELNTTYEVILNDGHYMGKFPASKTNSSYLNLTAGDYLNYIVRTEMPEEYIYSIVEYKRIPCKKINYINPVVEKSDELRYNFYNVDDSMDIENMQSISVDLDKYSPELELRVREYGGYEYLSCKYNGSVIKKFTLTGWESGQLREVDLRNVYFSYWDYYWETYGLKNEEDYLLYFGVLNPNKSFNTTVHCTFFDSDYYVHNSDIYKDPYDRDYNFLGKPEVTFNFTLVYER